MTTIAKICGKDRPSGTADWVKHRAEQFIEALKLKRKSMPHHSTYRRVSGELISIDELEAMVSQYLTEKKFFGKQVLLSMDRKVLRGILMNNRKALTCWPRTCRARGLL